jgi:hypothetical protein
MDLLSLIAGIALGAAFSPFWMKVWGLIKSKLSSMTTKDTL